jgi:DNA repair exonuclease SbcCD ATPase subunit
MNTVEEDNISNVQDNEELSKNSLFVSLQKELESILDVETKLHRIIECMQASISQTGSPSFRCFWEARKLCLQLFKEPLAPSVRTLYWAKYSEISQEAYRLKEILDEQSAFATEQIDKAIEAIEKSIQELSGTIEKQEEILFPEHCNFLSNNFAKYSQLQKEINILNSQASRVNALRKELIRTQMRVKQKNKFFKRLSSLGDSVFPRRKELIKEISNLFISDIESYVKDRFVNEINKGSLFALREEIKALQGIAKILTLNSHAFAQTRKELSTCWDQMKEVDKERKREKNEHLQEIKKNEETILVKIKDFGAEVAEGKLSIHEAEKRVDEIFAEMKQTRLGREEVSFLKSEIAKAEQPILELKRQEEAKRKEQEQERHRKREEQLEQLRKAIATFEQDITTADPSHLGDQFAALEKEITESDISSPHRQELRRKLVPLRDAVIEKVEKMRLEKSGENLSDIRILLKERKERRQKVKEQYEIYRKQKGSSGLGFEQMLKLNEQIAEEKKRLEKLDESVKELEKKLSGKL